MSKYQSENRIDVFWKQLNSPLDLINCLVIFFVTCMLLVQWKCALFVHTQTRTRLAEGKETIDRYAIASIELYDIY